MDCTWALGIKNTRTGAAVTRIISAVYGRWRMDIKNALVKSILDGIVKFRKNRVDVQEDHQVNDQDHHK